MGKLLTPEEIKKKRKALKLSQKGLAEESGLGLASIKRWESGQCKQSATSDATLRRHLRPNPMKAFRERLSDMGIKRKLLNDVVLPEWWSDSMGNEPNGMLMAAGYVADYFGFDRESLLKHTKDPKFVTDTGSVRYKAPENKKPVNKEKEESLRIATSIGIRSAAHFGDVVKPETAEIPDPKELRDELLKRGEHRWVSLDDLLYAAWKYGIGVIHLNKKAFPIDTTKPDALAAWSGDKRMIVLIKEQHAPSWLSYTVAHELGHFFHKHIPEGGFHLDQNLQAQRVEAEERMADDFAMVLLTGMPDLSLYISYRPKSRDLAQRARQYGLRYRVAPGVVALNWGMNTGNWAIANGAVKILDEGQDALELVQEYRDKNIDWDFMSDDRQAWAHQVSDAPSPKRK